MYISLSSGSRQFLLQELFPVITKPYARGVFFPANGFFSMETSGFFSFFFRHSGGTGIFFRPFILFPYLFQGRCISGYHTLERVLVHIIDGSVLVCHSHVRLKSEYGFHFSGKQIEVASFQSGGGRRKQGAAEYLPVQTDILFITLRSRKDRIQYR